MGFDAQNFGIGLLTGWATAYGVYRARHLIASTVRSAQQGAVTVQNSATRTADSRYITDLIERCESSHLAGSSVKLSDILTEPRFIPAPSFAAPAQEEEFPSPFNVVPIVHDYPALHAPYNVETLSINDLALGSHAIAILGQPGSGRTTALLTIALHSLGRTRFTPPVDSVQQRLDSEESRLDEKARAVRVKERVLMEQRAKEQLANERGAKYDADEAAKAELPLFNRLMPVYTHLADIQLRGPEYGAEIDPAEPLVRAVQHGVKRVTASTIPRHLYSRISKGQVLLLLDGYDDLPEADRPLVLAWLKAFMTQYKDNFVIIAGPVTGYGGLTNLGFTPVFMRPWIDVDTGRYIEKWAGAWPAIARKGRRKAAPPTTDAVARAKLNNRALSPYDLALKTWANFADDTEMGGFEGWLRAYIARLLPADRPLAQVLSQLTAMGALQLDEGYITPARLSALAIVPDSSAPTPTPAEEAELTTDDLREAVPEKKGRGGRGKPKTEDDAESATAQGRLLGELRRGGLLVRYRGDRYQFVHPLIAAYLASLTLKDRPQELAAKGEKPAWSEALMYANLNTSLDAIANARLTTVGDILNQQITELSRWLPYAPSDASWRGALLRELGTMLSAPNQYPLMRERALAALVETRDKNALLILRRTVRSPNVELRRLACIGMGAMGDPDGARDLMALIRDQDENVRVSATIALGSIGTNESLEAMAVALTEGSERVQRAAAETFAALPEAGYPTLWDAVNSGEMMIRRAAVLGLRRIRTPWATLGIYRAFLEDNEWYVRSAAQQAFQEIQYGRSIVPTAGYPTPDNIDWLKMWVAGKGEKLPAGDGAIQMLARAMQEGDPTIRALAAVNMGQLGQVNALKPLYTALRDKQDGVRVAAHQALATMQMQMGHTLPSPN
jgi:HEAT repeat protein